MYYTSPDSKVVTGTFDTPSLLYLRLPPCMCSETGPNEFCKINHLSCSEGTSVNDAFYPELCFDCYNSFDSIP